MAKERKIIIADASPLIAFGRMNQILLLTDTLGELLASTTVIEECTRNLSFPGAKEINKAMEEGIIVKHNDPHHHIEEHKVLFDILGKGEATSIILAKQLNTGLLIDEKLGRQQATKMELKIIGTAGVLVLAKQKGFIKKVTPLLSKLRMAGYYLSDELVKNVLIQTNE